MEEKDFKRIEDLVSNVVDGKLGQFNKEFSQEIHKDLGQFRKEFREDINEDFRRHIGILAEDFQHKPQLVGRSTDAVGEARPRQNRY